MKNLTKIVCLAVTAGLLGCASSALAQTAATNAVVEAPSTNAAPVKAKKPKAKAKVSGSVVVSVDNEAKTITLKDHDKAVKVTSKTKITKGSEAAMLSDIQPGETVRVSVKNDEAGNPTATSIKVDVKAADKPKKTKAATPEAKPATAQ